MAGRNKGATLVIFGISGDLAQRKLLPALSELDKANYLPKDFQIVGVSRRLSLLTDILPAKCKNLKKYSQIIKLDAANLADYQELKAKLRGSSQVIFYLAIPPTAVLSVVHNLGEAGLNGPNAKLLLEKPFGTDYASAKQLISQINKYYKEPQVYRIDHYLAKEAAQNIAVFLGGNAVFRDAWAKDYIEKIEIIASEKIGIEGRADFWESTGTLRDFVQSHMLQLAALTLMEPCDDFEDVERIPALRLKALSQLKVVLPSVRRGQYKDYRQEVKNPRSGAETFVSLQLSSKDPRWRGVPITLATGKRLSEKLTEIRIDFKRIKGARGNRLIFRIQPREGIEFDLWVKKPGPKRQIEKKQLSFYFKQYFQRLPDAYEQVLLDVLNSNHSLFASGAEVLASWKVLQPVIDAWESKRTKDLVIYPSATPLSRLL